MTNIDLIVTRHQGLLGWLASNLPAPAGHVWAPGADALVLMAPGADGGEMVPAGRTIPIRAHVGPQDVKGLNILGVLPLALARHAASVTEVEMPGLCPAGRGKELTPAEMDAAGARFGEALAVAPVAPVAQMEPADPDIKYPGRVLIAVGTGGSSPAAWWPSQHGHDMDGMPVPRKEGRYFTLPVVTGMVTIPVDVFNDMMVNLDGTGCPHGFALGEALVEGVVPGQKEV